MEAGKSRGAGLGLEVELAVAAAVEEAEAAADTALTTIGGSAFAADEKLRIRERMLGSTSAGLLECISTPGLLAGAWWWGAAA